MAQITFKGDAVRTVGQLPAISAKAPGFTLTGRDLADVTMEDFAGKRLILNIFPSLDTPVCAASVRRFNEEANRLDNTVVLCVSADLPFAQDRFCAAEGLENVIPLSVFRSEDFGTDYGVTISGGPLSGLLSRAIVIINEAGEIIYTEQVPEITNEPDYEAALSAVKKG